MKRFSGKPSNHSVWIGIRLSSDATHWLTAQGDTVDQHNADWAPGQPNDGFGTKQCAVAKWD